MLKNRSITALFLAILIVCISYFVDFSSGGGLSVYYLNIGQGDSALIETENGIKILVDAGRGDNVIDELEKVMPFWDKEIDILLISHGDLDHIGGFFDVLDSYSINEVWRSGVAVTSQYEEELLGNVSDLDINIKEFKKGDKIVLDTNTYIDFYWPPSVSDISDRNGNSLVFELIHGANQFLFTGDATIETELELIKDFPIEIDSDILKVAHHGSKGSTSQFFLEKVTPDFSILSYGNNSYGHPHQEVLDKLDESGGEVLHTKDRATIVARSDGQNIEISYLEDLLNQASFLQSLISTIFVDSFDTSS